MKNYLAILLASASTAFAVTVSTPVSAAMLGVELVQNGNAETGDTTGWLSTGIDIVSSSSPGTLGLPPSTDIGNFSFTGGVGLANSQTLTQQIDVSSLAAWIDNGEILSSFSLFIQSRSVPEHADLGEVLLSFLDGGNSVISSQQFVDNPIPGVFDWNQFSDERILPVGTRFIEVSLNASRQAGISSDAYFDEISLILNSTKSVPESSTPLSLISFGAVLSLITNWQRRKRKETKL